MERKGNTISQSNDMIAMVPKWNLKKPIVIRVRALPIHLDERAIQAEMETSVCGNKIQCEMLCKPFELSYTNM